MIPPSRFTPRPITRGTGLGESGPDRPTRARSRRGTTYSARLVDPDLDQVAVATSLCVLHPVRRAGSRQTPVVLQLISIMSPGSGRGVAVLQPLVAQMSRIEPRVCRRSCAPARNGVGHGEDLLGLLVERQVVVGNGARSCQWNPFVSGRGEDVGQSWRRRGDPVTALWLRSVTATIVLMCCGTLTRPFDAACARKLANSFVTALGDLGVLGALPRGRRSRSHARWPPSSCRRRCRRRGADL